MRRRLLGDGRHSKEYEWVVKRSSVGKGAPLGPFLLGISFMPNKTTARESFLGFQHLSLILGEFAEELEQPEIEVFYDQYPLLACTL